MYHGDKFCQIWLNGCGNIIIFLFLKMAAVCQMVAVCHLDLQGVFWDYPQRVRGRVYHCAKFGSILCSSFHNMKV